MNLDYHILVYFMIFILKHKMIIVASEASDLIIIFILKTKKIMPGIRLPMHAVSGSHATCLNISNIASMVCSLPGCDCQCVSGAEVTG